MMSRQTLRRPVAQIVSGLGWAALVLIWVPALLSLLPIRVVVGDAVILPTGGCLQRVSTRGVVHGPDSPHWAMTGTERCLDQGE